MTISVTQLNNYIHGLFDIDGVLSDLSVCGEITNVKPSRDGWFFSLKDETASVNCFCYANQTEPVQGTMAVAEGQLNYFTKSGTVSFFVRRLTATDNTGVAYKRYVELRDKLYKEGLFDEERKKKVPHSARKIGVVTSETGAVIHDIKNVVSRRQPFSDIYLYPVKVQGVGADEEIVRGIKYFGASDVDVVIVGRGGGSNEDLSVFNSEIVVRAIADCPKPVVSAVGHEIDYTLCDFVADKRAVTPTEAAEFVTLDAEREKLRVTSYLERINGVVNSRLREYSQSVTNSCKVLYYGIGHRLESMQRNVSQCLDKIRSATVRLTERNEQNLDKAVNRLASLNPMSVLKRGYGFVSKEGKVVNGTDAINVGDKVKINLFDGSFCANVTEKEKKQ